MNQSKELKKLIVSKDTLIMPDAYDPVSARLIEISGFKAVQCSGYSYSISAAKNREIDISRTVNVDITKNIVEAVKIPVMADAEDGFGDIKSVRETVELFMAAGVSGLNLEDQILESGVNATLCADLMAGKIQSAREVAEKQDNNDFIINGRTDVLKTIENREDALIEAVERSNLYYDAGADITFITYVETLDEVKFIKKEVKSPISIAAGMPYNIENFTISDLRELGVERVSFPTLLIYSSLKALQESLLRIKNDDFKSMTPDMLYNTSELDELLKK
jgi:2-methylisocitrate lyase-like PEP mutase family enzyme